MTRIPGSILSYLSQTFGLIFSDFMYPSNNYTDLQVKNQ